MAGLLPCDGFGDVGGGGVHDSKKMLTSFCAPCRPTTSMRSRTGTDSCSGGSDVVLFVIGVLRAVAEGPWGDSQWPHHQVALEVHLGAEHSSHFLVCGCRMFSRAEWQNGPPITMRLPRVTYRDHLAVV